MVGCLGCMIVLVAIALADLRDFGVVVIILWLIAHVNSVGMLRCLWLWLYADFLLVGI